MHLCKERSVLIRIITVITSIVLPIALTLATNSIYRLQANISAVQAQSVVDIVAFYDQKIKKITSLNVVNNGTPISDLKIEIFPYYNVCYSVQEYQYGVDWGIPAPRITGYCPVAAADVNLLALYNSASKQGKLCEILVNDEAIKYMAFANTIDGINDDNHVTTELTEHMIRKVNEGFEAMTKRDKSVFDALNQVTEGTIDLEACSVVDFSDDVQIKGVSLECYILLSYKDSYNILHEDVYCIIPGLIVGVGFNAGRNIVYEEKSSSEIIKGYPFITLSGYDLFTLVKGTDRNEKYSQLYLPELTERAKHFIEHAEVSYIRMNDFCNNIAENAIANNTEQQKSSNSKENNMKCLMITGLVFSIFGTVITGFIAQGGVPKSGEIIKAPNRKLIFFGWSLLLLGFVAQLIATVFM